MYYDLKGDKYHPVKKEVDINELADTVDEMSAELDGKVDKVEGKGLSANDFTNTLKTKLDGVASGAEVNVQSDWSQSDSSEDDYIKNKPASSEGVSF